MILSTIILLNSHVPTPLFLALQIPYLSSQPASEVGIVIHIVFKELKELPQPCRDVQA